MSNSHHTGQQSEKQTKNVEEEATLERKRLYDLFEQAPAAIAILHGPNLVYELANPLYQRLIGRTDLLGKPGRLAVPELEPQGVWDMLEGVYQSGRTYTANEFPAQLDRNGDGTLDQGYFNFEMGKLEYVAESIDIDTLVRETIDMLQQMTVTHTLYLYGTTDQTISGDGERLSQVLTNLINNAVKYSPQAKRVDVFLAASNYTVTIQVRDYGIGIPKEHQQNIFERFYRISDQRSPLFPGLGIGLYLSTEIVQKHGGKILLESIPGQGSTFSVILPCERNTPLGDL